jgi:hypothetical protein
VSTGDSPAQVLQENVMSKRHSLTAALVGAWLATAAASASAADPKVEASVTIEGKTIALPHARAFSTGMPFVLIYFVEKPLDGLKYGTAGTDATWSGGAYGTMLRFAPALDPRDEGKPVQRYVIPEAAAEEDDRVALRSARIGNWQAQWLSQEGIRIESLESSNGVVRGTLSWRGKAPVSAWSASFSVPLEEGVL